MTDIVERLRTCGPSMWTPQEVADEIERLRAERVGFGITELEAEIERLKAALQECVEELEGYHEAVPESARAALARGEEKL